MARSTSYLERGVQPLDWLEKGIEILSIGSYVPTGIDNERGATFLGPILLIVGKPK